ncbi:MAG: carboxylesterase [Pseudomonadota bacterium]
MSSPVIIETAPNPDAAVILLHGLGADGHDFVPIVQQMQLPSTSAIRFVFPHAPQRPVTINGGMSMPAWFDILGLDRTAAADEAGIRESSALLSRLVDEQIEAGIPPQRIVVAGFSQGGAIALFTGLTRTQPLAGVLALSTYLPLQQVVVNEHAGRQSALPILMVHGTDDPVLPMALAQDARDFIQALGYDVRWQTYPMPHSVCMEEIDLIREWLLARFTQD